MTIGAAENFTRAKLKCKLRPSSLQPVRTQDLRRSSAVAVLAMEFASHFSLDEALLTTTVETFVASDLRTREKVLIHVFPAAQYRLTEASSGDQVTGQFQRLTGASVPIREAGVDNVTQYAYVVTDDIPHEDIVKWSSGPSPNSNGLTAILGSAPSIPAAPPQPYTAPTPRPAAAPASGATGVFAPRSQPAPAAQTGSFTKEFLALQGKSPTPPATTPSFPSAPPVAPAEPRLTGSFPTSAPKSSPGAFTRMFSSSSLASPAAPGNPAAPQREPAGSVPPPPSPMASGPAKAPGAFTRMFGPNDLGTTAKPEAKAPATGAFTKMFAGPESAPPVETPRPAPPVPVAQPIQSAAPAWSAPQMAPQPPQPPAPQPTARGPQDATRIFSGGGSVTPPPPPVMPSGPSEYTKVISGAALRDALTSSQAAPAPPTAPPAPQFTMPPMQPPAVPTPQFPPAPGFPAAAPPPQPQYAVPTPAFSYPVVPPPQPPAMPQPHMPAIPGAAQWPPATPPKQRSWMPLLIVLNVLFLLAILIVVIFALKGH